MDKWKDINLSFEERAQDLVSKLTLEEKVGQMLTLSPGIPRLGINEYNWWNEALHGVARAGIATVFPQTIGMAASFNLDLMRETADIISTEARAKHHEAKRNGEHGMNKGLTMFSPNVNIFRDPRWGRGQETYGEDPYLTSKMGVEYCKGLQGDDEKYLKTLAMPKHYAVHSGPENLRHEFDAIVNEKDLYETYLPAFDACINEAGALGIMGAYNRVNGEAACASKMLINDILRGKWGFEGVVVSDCGAIEDIHSWHKITECACESAAAAVKAGCDLNCGFMYSNLVKAVEDGKLTEEDIDKCVYRLMLLRMKLGMFDDDSVVPYADIPYEVNDSKKHHKVCKEMTAESIVLLKNDKKALPLKKKKYKKIAVVGPNANSKEALLGNYCGEPAVYSTILDGVRMAHPNAEIIYAKGCNVNGVAENNVWGEGDESQIWEAVAAAKRADVVIVASGLNANLEGEESPAAILEKYIDTDKLPFELPKIGGDKENIDLPMAQIELIKRVSEVGKPVILVNLTGSCISMSEIEPYCNAIMQCWYPGQFGGEVIAKMIFGEYSPSGKLPVTFYKNTDDLPPFTDYEMDNRTYRYFEGEPMYPFGYGLSYSKIEYYRIYISKPKIAKGEDIDVTVSVMNKGKHDVKETVQVYLVDEEASVKTPLRKLVAFEKVNLPSGKEKTLTMTIKAKEMQIINKEGAGIIESGRFSLYVGGGQPDVVTEKLYKRDSLHIGFLVE